MAKITCGNRLLIAVVLVFAAIAQTGSAFAWGEPPREDHHRGREVVYSGHRKYYYDSGRFYRWSLFGLINIVPPAGVFVSFLPAGSRTIVVGGTPYFCYNDVYYAPYHGGYIVVPRPVAPYQAAPVPLAPRETVVINVPNRDGSFTPITLVKRDNGYFGPQGEYYAGNPTVEQLRALYGR